MTGDLAPSLEVVDQSESVELGDVAVPTGTVTFVLADVEGSTRLWESDPQAAAEALQRVNELIDESVATHGGARPVEQGEGDSAVATFRRASDAVAAALDLQLALAAEDDLPRVRIGLHSGEAQLRDPGNYFGRSVNRCARIRTAAHGGQTVTSRSTYELVVDHLPEGVSLRDLGPHVLKDLARPEHLYQLCHPELDNDFPPLRSLASMLNNLPLQLTSFVGRDDQMRDVRKLLDESRMVTLTGSGGCGKTRLAIQVAAEVLDAYADGVWWVDLGPIDDPALVPNALASVLSVKEVPLQSLIDTLTAYLRDKELLAVLDNCEHLIGSSAELAQRLVTNCPAVTVVATSREPLGVPGETPWRIPSLAFPAPESEPEVEALQRFEAVRLFVERAMKARPGFAIDPEHASPIAQICRRLDGIPLAIELAASRIRVLTPGQIASGLDDRFRLLTGGTRTALPRQRTLEASVDWSYNLLEEDERKLLARLTVFSGGFSLDAAEDVCSGAGIEEARVLDLLTNLVDRSLVQVEDAASFARYRLLETIRHYGMRKLADSGEGEAARMRHLDFYLRFAEEAEHGLQGPYMTTTLAAVDADYDNVRAAIEWAIHSEMVDEALRFASPLFTFWFVRGRYSEGVRSVEAALSLPGGNRERRAEALALTANLASQMAEFPRAHELADRAVNLAREAAEPRTLSVALNNLAWIESFSDPPRARALTDECLAILRDVGGPFELARCLSIRGIIEVQAGELSEARRVFDESIALLGEPANEWLLQVDLLWLGTALSCQGELALGESVVRRGLALSHELRDDVFRGLQLGTLSILVLQGGRYEEARALLEEAVSLGKATNSPWVSVTSRGYLGLLAYATGELDSASECLQQSIEMWRFLGYRWAESFTLDFLARTDQARGDAATSRAHADEALAVARDCKNSFVTGQALVTQATLASADANDQRAEGLAREAVSVLAAIGSKWGTVGALEALSFAVGHRGSHMEAVRLLGAAESLRKAVGYRRLPVEKSPYEAEVELLRAELGAKDFASAWKEGLTMSMDAAVDYAARGRGPRKRPSTGWASLTPAELDVVRQVAQGLTNPQIGAKLFISRRTVQAHLSSVFVKLGISSRSELAAEATRRNA